VIIQLKESIYKYTNEKFDYCLAHIYKDGNDKIDRHSDRESMNKIIYANFCLISFSLKL